MFEKRVLGLELWNADSLEIPEEPALRPVFGHILQPEAAPAPIRTQESLAGRAGVALKVGCLASVLSVEREEGGPLLVEYETVRRFLVKGLQGRGEGGADGGFGGEGGYNVAAVEWLNDVDENTISVDGIARSGEVQAQELADYTSEVERAVYSYVTQIYEISAKLGKGGALPESILRYAPEMRAPKKESPLSYTSVGSWERETAVWKAAREKSLGRGLRQKPQKDPYRVAQETTGLGKELRQELFSFACASIIDGSIPQNCVLLRSRSTLSRLEFVLKTAEPFLESLRTELKMNDALK